jgi:hypothetical protein
MKSMVILSMLLAVSSGGSGAINEAAATRFLGIDPTSANTTQAKWNGRNATFVDYLTGADEDELQVFVVYNYSGRLHSAKVTTGKRDCCVPHVAAIGFANADVDAAKELIVILQRPIFNYDVGGSLYEVRVFDDLKAGQESLTPLLKISARFGSACDCQWRGGNTKRYKFKTIAAVQKELKRLGY